MGTSRTMEHAVHITGVGWSLQGPRTWGDMKGSDSGRHWDSPQKGSGSHQEAAAGFEQTNSRRLQQVCSRTPPWHPGGGGK